MTEHLATMTFPPAGSGKHSPTVTMGNLLYMGKVPIFGFCRVAVAAGLTGRLKIILADGKPSCEVDLEKGAKLSMVELDKGGLRTVPYRAFSMRAKPQDERIAA